MLGTRGCGHPRCAGGCSPVPRGWGQDIPCRPPLHGRSPHLPHRPCIHPCARGSGSGSPSLGGQSWQGGRWAPCTGRNIQPGRIPEPRRGKAGPSLNAPIPPLCPNPGAAEPSMGLEPEPTTFLQTCLGVGFVSSRGLDEGWQDRRMDRMDRQMDGQTDGGTAMVLRSRRRNPAPAPSLGKNRLLLPSLYFPGGITQSIKGDLKDWELQPPLGAFPEQIREPCPSV